MTRYPLLVYFYDFVLLHNAQFSIKYDRPPSFSFLFSLGLCIETIVELRFALISINI